MIILWILLALIATWVLLMGAVVARDSRQLGLSNRDVVRFSLRGIVDPLRYWYYERPLHFSQEERAGWLARIDTPARPEQRTGCPLSAVRLHHHECLAHGWKGPAGRGARPRHLPGM